jgi:hypothetical protein
MEMRMNQRLCAYQTGSLGPMRMGVIYFSCEPEELAVNECGEPTTDRESGRRSSSAVAFGSSATFVSIGTQRRELGIRQQAAAPIEAGGKDEAARGTSTIARQTWRSGPVAATCSLHTTGHVQHFA